MKTTKKFLALLMSMVMICSALLACGEQTVANDDDDDDSSSASSEYKNLSPEEVLDELEDAKDVEVTFHYLSNLSFSPIDTVCIRKDGDKIEIIFGSTEDYSVYYDLDEHRLYQPNAGSYSYEDYSDDWDDLASSYLNTFFMDQNLNFFLSDDNYELKGKVYQVTADALSTSGYEGVEAFMSVHGTTYTFAIQSTEEMGDPLLLASCEVDFGNCSVKLPTVENNVPQPPIQGGITSKIPSDLNFAQMGLSGEDLTLNVAYTEGTNGEYTRRSLKTDWIDESDVDIATRYRDQRLKEQLGLELYIEPAGYGIADMESAIGMVLAAGSAEWDILAAYQYYGISMARRGYLLNLADLKSEGADYIDLNASYWANAYNDVMSYKGAYYWITGDLALRYIGGMYCTYVNARLYNDLLADTYDSIYTIAKEGRWTLDLMTEMASRCYEDTGSIMGEPDAEDTYGFGWEPCDPIDAMALGAGVQFTYKDPATGDISITVANPHTFDVAEKLNKLAKVGDFSYQFPNSDSTTVMPAFANGSLLFTVNKLFMAEAYLADMEDDYYIIPVPKFDENQKSYITGIHDGCTIFGITYCTNKVPQAAAALEFLCAYSSKDVTPLYYEGSLKGRYTRDPEAAEMIDIIHNSVTTDFGVVWGNALDNLPHLFRDCEVLNQKNVTRRVNTWTNSLDMLTEELSIYIGYWG